MFRRSLSGAAPRRPACPPLLYSWPFSAGPPGVPLSAPRALHPIPRVALWAGPQDFGAEDPLSELQCTRHDIAELMCRVIEHGGAAPDVDAMSKCCKVIRVALCGLGWGSTRGPKLMANAAALATWKVPDPTGTKRQPRVYHVLRSAILLQHRAALLPSKGVAYSAVHGRCYAALLRLATGAYARLRTCAQSAAGALLSNTPRAVRVRLIAGMIGGLREARDADGLKGTVFLLKKDLVLRVLCQHLDLVVLFLEAICEVWRTPSPAKVRDTGPRGAREGRRRAGGGRGKGLARTSRCWGKGTKAQRTTSKTRLRTAVYRAGPFAEAHFVIKSMRPHPPPSGEKPVGAANKPTPRPCANPPPPPGMH